MKRRAIPPRVRAELYRISGGKCAFCPQLLAYDCHHSRRCGRPVMEAHHVVPHSTGGCDNMINLLAACRACNAERSNRETAQAAAYRRGMPVQLRLPVV